MKARRSGFHSEKEEQVRIAELSATREAEQSALDDNARRDGNAVLPGVQLEGKRLQAEIFDLLG